MSYTVHFTARVSFLFSVCVTFDLIKGRKWAQIPSRKPQDFGKRCHSILYGVPNLTLVFSKRYCRLSAFIIYSRHKSFTEHGFIVFIRRCEITVWTLWGSDCLMCLDTSASDECQKGANYNMWQLTVQLLFSRMMWDLNVFKDLVLTRLLYVLEHLRPFLLSQCPKEICILQNVCKINISSWKLFDVLVLYKDVPSYMVSTMWVSS